MKRIFAHIGFSMAAALIVLNVFPAAAFYAAGALFALLLFSLCIQKYRLALAVPMCLGAALLACILFIVFTDSAGHVIGALDGKTVSCTAYVTDFPERSGEYYVYPAKVVSADLAGAPQPFETQLRVRTPLSAEPYTLFSCRVRFYTSGNSALDSYGAYAKGVYVRATVLSAESGGERVRYLSYLILQLRQQIRTYFSLYPGGDRGALACALLIGDTSAMSDRAYADFTASGVTHLMAVSGLNTTVLGTAAYWVLRRLGASEKLRVFLTLVLLFAYCALTGFTGSVVRAAVMLGVILTGQVCSKKADALNSLGFAVFLLCLNPFAAVDVGTLLSCAATLALLTLVPHLVDKLPSFGAGVFARVLRTVLESLAITFGVSVYTLPVTLLFFQTVSPAAFAANILLVPLANFVMGLALAAFCLQGVPLLSDFLVSGLRLLCGFMLDVTSFFASFRYSQLSLDDPVWALAAGLALFMFGAAFVLYSKKSLQIAAVVTCVLFAVSGLSCVFSAQGRVQLRAAASYDGVAAVLQNGGECVVVGTGKAGAYDVEQAAGRKKVLWWIVPSYAENESAAAAETTYRCNVQNLLVPYEKDEVTMNVRTENLVVSRQTYLDLWDGVRVEYIYKEDGRFLVQFEIYGRTVAVTDDAALAPPGTDLLLCETASGASGFGTVVCADAENGEIDMESGCTFLFAPQRQIMYRKDRQWET